MRVSGHFGGTKLEVTYCCVVFSSASDNFSWSTYLSKKCCMTTRTPKLFVSWAAVDDTRTPEQHLLETCLPRVPDLRFKILLTAKFVSEWASGDSLMQCLWFANVFGSVSLGVAVYWMTIVATNLWNASGFLAFYPFYPEKTFRQGPKNPQNKTVKHKSVGKTRATTTLPSALLGKCEGLRWKRQSNWCSKCVLVSHRTLGTPSPTRLRISVQHRIWHTIFRRRLTLIDLHEVLHNLWPFAILCIFRFSSQTWREQNGSTRWVVEFVHLLPSRTLGWKLKNDHLCLPLISPAIIELELPNCWRSCPPRDPIWQESSTPQPKCCRPRKIVTPLFPPCSWHPSSAVLCWKWRQNCVFALQISVDFSSDTSCETWSDSKNRPWKIKTRQMLTNAFKTLVCTNCVNS